MQRVFHKVESVLRLACVIALVMVGFAHKPASAYPAEVPMPVYELPDGTVASICLAEHDSKPHALKDFGCDACRLSSAVLVPMSPCFNGQAIAFSVKVRVFERRERLARALYPPSSGPRAPPLASLMFV